MSASSSAPKAPEIRRDWLAKSLAGSLLGLTLAFALSGLLPVLASGVAPAARAQLMMWLVAPVWLGVLASCFFFRSGLRAWLWLGGANLLAWAALCATRFS